MQLKSFLSVLISFTVSLGAVVSITPPSSANLTLDEFSCKQNEDGDYVTYIRFKTEPNVYYELVRWIYYQTDEWSFQRRCNHVTKKFQALSDNGWLNEIGIGRSNGQPILCGVRSPQDYCPSGNVDNILVTLPPGSNPDFARHRLWDVGNRSRKEPLSLCGAGDNCEKLITIENGQRYLNMDVLKRIIRENETPIDEKSFNSIDTLVD